MFSLKPPKWVYVLFLMGICSIGIRVILDSRFGNSALLYVAVPFLVSILIFHLVPSPQDSSKFSRLMLHLKMATVIFLGTSAFLFEGFICVLFFIPIYYLFVIVGYTFVALADWSEQRNSQKDTLKSSMIPIFVAVLAIEGLSPSTSFERKNYVHHEVVVDLDIAKLKSNMSLPLELPKRRQWFLSIFPLPVEAQAGSLKDGDIHKLKFLYKKWFFTNTHEGEFHLKIDEVGDQHVKTSVVKNTSYLSKYLKIRGTDIEFEPLANGQTKISLTISYERLLDPAWYFAPMQEYAVQQSADYFVNSIFLRETM
ncbi:hypothetical protein [Hirschia litorea]|uniref:Polyketide cyclase / dehydrase and lipid transport n=1 Tax=Hirschia litorea TaxID=1199156 RepID=A0ABW2IPJ5_9PROT